MNVVFRIFGTPRIFDIFKSTDSEEIYFQNFYDKSRENTKFVIHRMASGRVSYNYLRYNFVSSEGRLGSFLGMSIVFENEYCFDVTNLYKLLDAVYKTILSEGVLVREVSNNPEIQAKYLVSRFQDAPNEIRRIEAIVLKNLEAEFLDDIHPLDNTFYAASSNLVRKLNNAKGNDLFLTALRKYAWVAISSDFEDNEELSLEKVVAIKSEIKRTKDLTKEISFKALEGEDLRSQIQTEYSNLESSKEIVKPYLQVQPELKHIWEELLLCQEDFLKLGELIQKNVLVPKTSGSSESPEVSKPDEGDAENAKTGKKKKKKDKKKKGKDSDESLSVEDTNREAEEDENSYSSTKNLDGRTEEKVRAFWWHLRKYWKWGLAIAAILVTCLLAMYQFYKSPIQSMAKQSQKVDSVPKGVNINDHPNSIHGPSIDSFNYYLKLVNDERQLGNFKQAIIYVNKAAEFNKEFDKNPLILEINTDKNKVNSMSEENAKLKLSPVKGSSIQASDPTAKVKPENKTSDNYSNRAKVVDSLYIVISPANATFTDGEKFTATIYKNGKPCSDCKGSWKFEKEISGDRNKYQTECTVKIDKSNFKDAAVFSYNIENKRIAHKINLSIN